MSLLTPVAKEGSKSILAGLSRLRELGSRTPTQAAKGVLRRAKNDWRGASGLGKFTRGAVGAGGLGGLGILAYGLANQEPPSSSTTFPTLTSQDNTGDLLGILDQYTQQARNRQNQTYQQMLAGLGTAERGALNDYIQGMNTAAGQQAQAVRDQYAEQSRMYGANSAAAAQTGMQAAGSINDIYGNAAAAAARPRGAASMTGGLTTSSGATRAMPEQMRAEGANLAAYLTDQAGIAARDAGYSSATARDFGNAVANEMTMAAYLDGLRRQYELETNLGMSRQELGAQNAANLANIEAQAADRRMQVEMQNALTERSVGDLLPQEYEAMVTEWDTMSDELKQRWVQGTGGQIQDADSYIAWLLENRPDAVG